jgi:hypothetical protein
VSNFDSNDYRIITHQTGNHATGFSPFSGERMIFFLLSFLLKCNMMSSGIKEAEARIREIEDAGAPGGSALPARAS